MDHVEALNDTLQSKSDSSNERLLSLLDVAALQFSELSRFNAETNRRFKDAAVALANLEADYSKLIERNQD